MCWIVTVTLICYITRQRGLLFYYYLLFCHRWSWGEPSALQSGAAVRRRHLRQKLQQEKPANQIPCRSIDQEGNSVLRITRHLLSLQCLQRPRSCVWFQVELFAVITGHGSDENGCGEFCVTSHHFLINGVFNNTRIFDSAGGERPLI